MFWRDQAPSEHLPLIASGIRLMPLGPRSFDEEKGFRIVSSMLRVFGKRLPVILWTAMLILQSLGITSSQAMINDADLDLPPRIHFRHPRNNSVFMWEERLEVELAVDGFSPESAWFHLAGSTVAKSRSGTFQVALAPGWHCLQASLSSDGSGNYQGGDTVCFTLWHSSRQVSMCALLFRGLPSFLS